MNWVEGLGGLTIGWLVRCRCQPVAPLAIAGAWAPVMRGSPTISSVRVAVMPRRLVDGLLLPTEALQVIVQYSAPSHESGRNFFVSSLVLSYGAREDTRHSDPDDNSPDYWGRSAHPN